MTLPKYLSFKPVNSEWQWTPEARKHSSSSLNNSTSQHRSILLQNIFFNFQDKGTVQRYFNMNKVDSYSNHTPAI